MKNHISIRFNDRVAERIEQLKSWLNSTQTGIIETAINQLYEIERTKRMNIQSLTEAVSRAVAKMEKDGVEGWGLENPDRDVFELVTMTDSSGCTSKTCNHVSHDPTAPHCKLVPKSGKLVYLDADEGDDTRDAWYTLITDNEPRFYQFHEPRHYWASIREVGVDTIPDWVLAQLAKN